MGDESEAIDHGLISLADAELPGDISGVAENPIVIGVVEPLDSGFEEGAMGLLGDQGQGQLRGNLWEEIKT